MPITQISNSNTFGQWLSTTQALVDKYNYYEETANLVFDTANSVYSVSASVNINSNNINLTFDAINLRSNGVNNTSNSVNSVSNSVNAQTALVLSTSNTIHDYVEESFDVANNVLSISLISYTHINSAFIHANASYVHANSGYGKANSGYDHANSGYIHANSGFIHINAAYVHANAGYVHANSSFDTINLALSLANIANIAIITDDNSINANYFPILSAANSGVLNRANTSSAKLYYNPQTGTIYTPTAVFTGNSYIKIPTGLIGERPANAVSGMMRYNATDNRFEGYSTQWGTIGGGATGGGADEVFIENSMNVTANYTITTGKSAMSTGPITIQDGVLVTIPDGSRWVVI